MITQNVCLKGTLTRCTPDTRNRKSCFGRSFSFAKVFLVVSDSWVLRLTHNTWELFPRYLVKTPISARSGEGVVLVSLFVSVFHETAPELLLPAGIPIGVPPPYSDLATYKKKDRGETEASEMFPGRNISKISATKHYVIGALFSDFLLSSSSRSIIQPFC